MGFFKDAQAAKRNWVRSTVNTGFILFLLSLVVFLTFDLLVSMG